MTLEARHENVFTILFIILYLIIPNYYMVSSSRARNNVSENQSIPSIEIRHMSNTQLQFNHSKVWENSYVVLNESLSLNASTHILINNSIVEFAPKIAGLSVYLTIGESSLLEIYNSTLFLNETTDGSSFIKFYGGNVSICKSSFIGMGISNPQPGFFAKDSQVFINNSTFDSGFTGFHFENSNEVDIINCKFKNMSGNGVLGTASNNICISNCSYELIDGIGFSLDTGNNVSINGSIFEKNDGICVQIQGLYYFDIYDLWLEGNTFQDSAYGMVISGKNVSIINNKFLNLTYGGSFVGGENYLIENNTYSGLLRGITTPAASDIPYEGEAWMAPSITNAIIKKNNFTNIGQDGINIDNYEYATLFRIEQNSFSNIGFSALSFTGNLGGEDSNNRSWVIGNLINNSAGFGIYGSYCTGFIHSYLAHFQFTSFVKNAFFNCSLGYTSFESDHYFLDDIRWDDGLFGNYWDTYTGKDEDNNQIGDSFYVVSTEYVEVDHAPLLSIDFLKQKRIVGSTHPVDLVRTKAELKVNNTLSWIILNDENTIVSVLLDGTPIMFEELDTNVTVSLEALKVGEHNVTLVIQAGAQIYRDLVWVQVFADESNLFTDIVILVGFICLVVAIVVVGVLGYKKR